MNFALKTHLGLAVLVLMAGWVGISLASLLPRRLRPLAGRYFAPALGLAVFTLGATAWAWAVHGGFRSLPFFAAGLGLAVVSSWVGPSSLHRLRALVPALLACQLTALPFTIPLALNGDYNPGNDTWTYLVQSQWLGGHGWRESVVPGPTQAPLSQIYFSTSSGTRVGAQNLLGAVHAISGARWSYDDYPLVLLAAYGAGALLLGAAVPVQTRRVRRWILGAIAGFGWMLHGFAFGMQHGFFPQTLGLTLGTAGLLLWGLTLRLQGATAALRVAAPSGVLLAAACIAYSELVPLFGAAAFFAAGLNAWLLPPSTRYRALAVTASVAFWVLLLCAPEMPRMLRALRLQAGAVVGSPVEWTGFEFLGHAAGLRAGIWELPVWTLGAPWLSWLALTVVLLGALLGLGGIRSLRRWTTERAGLIGFALTCVLLFFWFRYGVLSPFPVGQGQSWSQFKLAGWICLPATILLAGALGPLRGPALLAVLLAGGASAFGGLKIEGALGRNRLFAWKTQTGQTFAPLRQVEEFARTVAARVPPGEAIRLDLPPAEQKLAQMLAYFLMDRPVVADWSEDSYIRPNFPYFRDEDALQAARWVIATQGGFGKVEIQRGPLALLDASTGLLLVRQIRGAHGRESDAENHWRWVAREIIYELEALRPTTPSVRPLLRARIIGRDASTRVTLSWHRADGSLVASSLVPLASVGTPFAETGPALSELGPRFEVRLTAEREGEALGVADPRRAAFQLLNASVFLAPP